MAKEDWYEEKKNNEKKKAVHKANQIWKSYTTVGLWPQFQCKTIWSSIENGSRRFSICIMKDDSVYIGFHDEIAAQIILSIKRIVAEQLNCSVLDINPWW